MKITLDTNVLVSATFWEGEAFRIIQLIEQKKVVCCLSQPILNEYSRVIHSGEILEKVERKHLAIKSALIKILTMCEVVEPQRGIEAVHEDPDDNKILECAVEAGVDYIVTYDPHLLKLREFKGIRIIQPKEFLAIVRGSRA
jgi:putative PIN family toxin of toxin-antitoxin system